MTDKQPEALRLADKLLEPIEGFPNPTALEKNAATLLRTQHAELQQWKNVFGHLGTADQCGNEWIRLQDAIERKDALLKQALEALKISAASSRLQRDAIDAITKEMQ